LSHWAVVQKHLWLSRDVGTVSLTGFDPAFDGMSKASIKNGLAG